MEGRRFGLSMWCALYAYAVRLPLSRAARRLA